MLFYIAIPLAYLLALSHALNVAPQQTVDPQPNTKQIILQGPTINPQPAIDVTPQVLSVQ